MINTPEGSKYGTPTSKTMSSQTPYGIATYSPLGLADIRPRADSGMSDDPSSANPYANDEGYASAPTNSSYVAPWAIYAFDWCKWPVQQHGSGDAAGKMAIGSYLEDGHNFVGVFQYTHLVQEALLDAGLIPSRRYKYSIPGSFLKVNPTPHPVLHNMA